MVMVMLIEKRVMVLGVYAASKRSGELIAETLRLELAPFDVKVLSIVNGAIKTLGQTYFDDFALPEGSLYKSIEETIASRAQGKDGRPRGELMPHCRKIVANMTEGKSGKIWLGEAAGGVKFGTTYLPTSLMVQSLFYLWRFHEVFASCVRRSILY